MRKFFYLSLVIVGAGVLFSSCATNQNIQRLRTDVGFQKATYQLATDYLESQKKGDSVIPFGLGAGAFYNLAEYKLVDFGWEMNEPAVFLRVKAGNKAGGNPIWKNYSIRFSHDPKLEASGDKYLGLRISNVGESIVKF